MKFELSTSFQVSPGQKNAIDMLLNNFTKKKMQTLLGITGSGKTFVMANIINRLQKPTLILAHNKTLAAQLYSELKTTKEVPLRPAHLIALEGLQTLKNWDLNDYDTLKKYYFEISDLFRHYLRNRFDILAVERPSEEIIPELTHVSELLPEQRQVAGDFLNHTDLVKFAKFKPDEDQPAKIWENVYEFVNQTKKEDVEE